MATPLRITLSAREAVAVGSAFAPYGEALSDAGVALDWISELRAAQEPLVLRVVAAGGSKADRLAVDGDWFCDSDGSAPARLPAAAWRYDSESRDWSFGRRWADAWDACANACWMLRAAADVGVAMRCLVAAAAACIRRSVAADGGWSPLPEPAAAALEAAEGWLSGAATRADAEAASGAAWMAVDFSRRSNYVTAAAAWCATAAAYRDGHLTAAAAAQAVNYAAAAAGAEAQPDAMSSLADVVRRAVPFADVLRLCAAG